MSFLAFALPILSPSPLVGESVSGCLLLCCWLSLYHNKAPRQSHETVFLHFQKRIWIISYISIWHSSLLVQQASSHFGVLIHCEFLGYKITFGLANSHTSKLNKWLLELHSCLILLYGRRNRLAQSPALSTVLCFLQSVLVRCKQLGYWKLLQVWSDL